MGFASTEEDKERGTREAGRQKYGNENGSGSCGDGQRAMELGDAVTTKDRSAGRRREIYLNLEHSSDRGSQTQYPLARSHTLQMSAFCGTTTLRFLPRPIGKNSRQTDVKTVYDGDVQSTVVLLRTET